jgi:hypothetical protein
MATLEEAAVAFTERFAADVAARGARMAWRRWPQEDYGAGVEQVVAFWMWPAAYAASTPPTDEDHEEWDGHGFWFELRHGREDPPPYPDGYAEFTIFIGDGKWMYNFAVDILASQHGEDSPAR